MDNSQELRPVAWMYEGPSGQRKLLLERALKWEEVNPLWKASPLYITPSATSAGDTVRREFLHAALYEICQRIEACGASTALTNAVMLASDLMSAVGNKHNMPNEYAHNRVLAILKAKGWVEPKQAAAPAQSAQPVEQEAVHAMAYELLDCVHTPNPTNPADYRIAPGKLAKFQSIIRSLDAVGTDGCKASTEEIRLAK